MKSGGQLTSRALSPAFLVCWFVLVSLQFGWVPGARYAWAYNLWQYLPPEVAVLLAVASLSVCVRGVRLYLSRWVSTACLALERMPAASLVGFALVALLLWLFRERELYGDSAILIWGTSTGSTFLFPDIGASFLIGSLHSLGRVYALALPEQLIGIQVAACLCGAATVVFVLRAAAYLAPGARGAATLLILCGGLLRVFAGHVEVYAFLLAAVSAYLWAALAYLEGRTSLVVPSLVLGVAIWLHFAALCLVPCLLVLPLLTRPAGAATLPIGKWLFAVGTALLPVTLFLVGAAVLGQQEELARMGHVLQELTGTANRPDVVQRWVRAWGAGPSRGTEYVFLSVGHLKYLVNAAHLFANEPPDASPARAEFYTWLVASTVLFVTLPFLLIAPGATREAGPFAGGSFTYDLLEGEPDEANPLAPWL